MPKVTAKPKARLMVRKPPWVPRLSTTCATDPQPNICVRKQNKAEGEVPTEAQHFSLQREGGKSEILLATIRTGDPSWNPNQIFSAVIAHTSKRRPSPLMSQL
jgi:hypothetical protein